MHSDQLLVQGVSDQFSGRPHAELDEEARAVRAHGLDAQVQVFGDFRQAATLGDPLKDFYFSIRQSGRQPVRVRNGSGGECILLLRVDLGRWGIAAAAQNARNRRAEFLWACFLRQVAEGTGSNGTRRVMFFGVDADNQHRQGWLHRLEYAQDLEAWHVGQVQVQNDEVPGGRANLLNRMLSGSCFGDVRCLPVFCQKVLQELFEATSEECVVVCEENLESAFNGRRFVQYIHGNYVPHGALRRPAVRLHWGFCRASLARESVVQ
ncbi:hypothetical protein NSPZN2_10264 [Nitrospira defluvii]|uniref:Uncharacterized protein n=1 Tax=Nitrospira defluvii TaxID=330214 RepID=A0ABN7KGI3_9BACT|nr:hypothetical protein NSPZN2_10264 [Nitrospira defluvii]